MSYFITNFRYNELKIITNLSYNALNIITVKITLSYNELLNNFVSNN